MAQITNFGDLTEEYSDLDSAKVVIIPVPYDQTSTWIRGADKGPAAILAASANMELYDIETDSQVYTKGIFTHKAIEKKYSPENMIEAVTEKARDYINKGKFIVVVGGEHSVSIGSIKAHVENNKDVTVLQLDAHCDLREEYNGSGDPAPFYRKQGYVKSGSERVGKKKNIDMFCLADHSEVERPAKKGKSGETELIVTVNDKGTHYSKPRTIDILLRGIVEQKVKDPEVW